MPIYHSLGLMSGSSLDGLDICYSAIENNNGCYSFEIFDFATISFPSELYSRLEKCRGLNSEELDELDWEFGEWVAWSCNKFMIHRGISAIDFIASHGHTVFHFPDRGLTRQIGNGRVMAELTKLRVINNFRQKDVAAGGQGAPIVPIGDLLFFPNITYCLNLGGIMNISIKENDSIISFDIGVCNQVLNHYARERRLEYDIDGLLGRRGKICFDLLDRLNALPFFSLSYPKSLDNGFSEVLINVIDSYPISLEDKMRSFYEHIAMQISRYVSKKDEILITGGGTHNSFLMELIIQKELNPMMVKNNLIDGKEALVMSLLGVRFLENKFNVLSSVTGAKHDTVCGNIYYPPS